MGALLNKSIKESIKNFLTINNSSYTGVDGTVRGVIDGDNNETALRLSDDSVFVKPSDSDSTGIFVVQTNAGNNVLAVDTANKTVRVNEGQINANTQYAYFGCQSTDPSTAGFSADTHYAIPFTIAQFGGTTASLAMGSSTSSSFNDTNPASSLTISSTAHDIVTSYWYVMDDITIDAVKWFHGADAATGDSTAAHLMAYTVDTTNGSTGGDLSSGTVVADGGTITNAGYEQIYYQSMTIQSADVDAGKVILFTFASDTINSDFSINAIVKYHIR